MDSTGGSVLAHGRGVRPATSSSPWLLGQQRPLLGTAGVLAFACDRIVERNDDFGFAQVLVDDLADRATVDDVGVRWSNREHRRAPAELEPRPGWAMGNAGIARELLRFARLREGGSFGYSVQWPDQPATRHDESAHLAPRWSTGSPSEPAR